MLQPTSPVPVVSNTNGGAPLLFTSHACPSPILGWGVVVLGGGVSALLGSLPELIRASEEEQ